MPRSDIRSLLKLDRRYETRQVEHGDTIGTKETVDKVKSSVIQKKDEWHGQRGQKSCEQSSKDA